MKKILFAVLFIALFAGFACAGEGLSVWEKFEAAQLADDDLLAGTDTSDTTQSAEGSSKAATAAQIKTYVLADLEATDDVSFGSVTASGAGGLAAGVASTTTGILKFYNSGKAYPFNLFGLGADAPSVGWRFPATLPAGEYLLTADTNGYLDYLDPATIGGTPIVQTVQPTGTGSTTSAPSEAAVGDALDDKADKTDISFVAATLADLKILTATEPVNGEPIITSAPSDKTKQTYTASIIDGLVGGLPHVASGYPSADSCNWNTTDYKLYCRTGDTVYESAAMALSATLDNTPPVASDFATDATGLEYAFTTSETSTVDCTQLTATWATAGTVNDFVGTASPCVSSTPVYADDTGTMAGAAGFLTDTASNASEAFSGVAIDNSLNVATESSTYTLLEDWESGATAGDDDSNQLASWVYSSPGANVTDNFASPSIEGTESLSLTNSTATAASTITATDGDVYVALTVNNPSISTEGPKVLQLMVGALAKIKLTLTYDAGGFITSTAADADTGYSTITTDISDPNVNAKYWKLRYNNATSNDGILQVWYSADGATWTLRHDVSNNAYTGQATGIRLEALAEPFTFGDIRIGDADINY